jgi:hypothetical protein
LSALSFNVPDSTSEKFFKSFYLHFLLNGKDFGESASIADFKFSKTETGAVPAPMQVSGKRAAESGGF